MAIITVADIKKEPYIEELSDSLAHDVELNKMIDAASLDIEQYIGAKLNSVTSQVDYFGNGYTTTTHLYLSYIGNIASEQVIVDTDKIFDATKTLPLTVNTDYDVFADEGLIILKKPVAKGRKIIKVTYNAGYTMANIPADIKRAVRAQVTSEWFKRGLTLGTNSTTTPDGSVISVDSGLIADVKKRLEPYKRDHF